MKLWSIFIHDIVGHRSEAHIAGVNSSSAEDQNKSKCGNYGNWTM